MKPTAILSADIHIRDSNPKCRLDEFFFTVDRKFTFILELAQKYKCPLLVAGDIGEEAEWPNWLLRWFDYKVKKYNVDIYLVAGQHDLKYHRVKHWEKSAIGVLETSGAVKLIFKPVAVNHKFKLFPFHFGQKLKRPRWPKNYGNLDVPCVAMAHKMVVENKALWKGQTEPQGVHILKKFPQYKLILTGDNHNPFVSRYKDRILVNPGSMTRHKADQTKHRPRVYLWYSEVNKVRRVYIPIEKGVMSREHIKVARRRSKKMEEYIEKMESGYNKSADYMNNLELHFAENKTSKAIRERVLESCHD